MRRHQPTPSLTPKQKLVLDFIQEFAAENSYAPSQQEIAKHFGFSSLGTVQNYLVRLERSGLLTKEWNSKRGMRVLTDDNVSARMLPLAGKVSAGRPIEAIEGNDTIDVPVSLLKQGEHFVLKVTGDSMVEDGILDGDFVVIKKQAVANNGETVVALINNEATIKKYVKKSSHIELHPANANYKPILVSGQEFRIEGILVGLIRKWS